MKYLLEVGAVKRDQSTTTTTTPAAATGGSDSRVMAALSSLTDAETARFAKDYVRRILSRLADDSDDDVTVSIAVW